MSKGYQWFSQDPRSGEWGEYDPKDNDGIEAAYKAGKKYTLKVSGYEFTVDPKALTQSSSRGSRPIKREERKSANPFDRQTSGTASSAPKALVSQFQTYAALTGSDLGCETTDYVGGSGLAKFFEDTKIPLDSLDALVVCFALQCSKPFQISKDEFLQGLAAQGVQSVDQVAKKLPEWKKMVSSDPATTKRFFLFCFDFMRDTEAAVIISCDNATSVLAIFCPQHFSYFPVAKISDFINNVHKKALTKDAWRGIFDVMAAHPRGDFSNFDEGQAWPTFIDDFVEYAKSK